MNKLKKEREVQIKEQLKELETEYKQFGLKFHNYNGGNIPMQFYADFKGMKLYWRTRSNCSQLRIGAYQPEEDLKRAEKEKHLRAQFIKDHETQADHQTPCIFCEFNKPEYVEVDHPERYYPRNAQTVEIYPLVPGDDFKGSLTAEEIKPTFKQLINELIPLI